MQRFRTFFMVVGLLCILAACGTENAPQGASSTAAPTPTPSPSKTTVFFQTEDNLRIAGWFYGETGKTAIIASHESRGDKSPWDNIATWLANRGFMVLAFDFRTYGHSDFQPNVNKDNLDKDMQAAIAFVRSKGAQRVILMGASLGAIISMKIAATSDVAGLISLSGGYYQEQAPPTLTVEQVKAMSIPKLFIACQDDPWAKETQKVYQDAVQPKELHLYPGIEHGTRIFRTAHGPDLYERILEFAQKVQG